MMRNERATGNKTITNLRKEWGIASLLSALFLAGGSWLLWSLWNPTNAVLWLVIASGVALYQFWFLWQHLADNRGQDGQLFATLGPANQMTILRAVLTGALAGFLPGAWPQGWLAWAPGGLYLLVAVLDFADGYVARLTRRTTRLGELLDLKWDGAGVLIGAVLAVRYEQVPVWYLLVALARYLFLLGLWVEGRSGRRQVELDPNMIRRALAGMQMGFIGVVLLPVFTPPATQVAAILFMLPFLVHFTRDYLWVTGRIAARAGGWQGALRAWLPLGLRAAQIVLLALVLVEQARAGFGLPGLALAAALALPAILLGTAGRLAALVVLLSAGFALQAQPLSELYWATLLTSTLLFVSGTGRFSLWKPEEWLIYHRAGEARQ